MPDHNAYIELEPYAQKIKLQMMDGAEYYGTGFIVDYAERRWIFTCWHNLEGPHLNFTGVVKARTVRFVNPEGPIIDLRGGRRIVGAKVDGRQVDVAAIETAPDEIPTELPRFNGKATMWMRGFDLPERVQIVGPTGEGIWIATTRHFLAQGFPGRYVDAKNIGLRCVQLKGMDDENPNSIPYLPQAGSGFSGGPVIEIVGETGALVGIHGYSYNSDLFLEGELLSTGSSVKIRTAGISGGAAPVAPLFAAIDVAGDGLTIADV